MSLITEYRKDISRLNEEIKFSKEYRERLLNAPPSSNPTVTARRQQSIEEENTILETLLTTRTEKHLRLNQLLATERNKEKPNPSSPKQLQPPA
jgi:hypothetical protein